MNKIKLAIADDYQVFREGVTVIVGLEDDMEFIFEAENGEELLQKLEVQQPDVILMDFKMPVMDGMKATRLVKEKYPAIKVIIISMYEDEKFVSSFKECGADGYLLKNAEPDEIISMIRKVMVQ